MTNIAARSKQLLSNCSQVRILNSRSKSMLGVVTMLQADMARKAEIKVITRSASDKVLDRQF